MTSSSYGSITTTGITLMPGAAPPPAEAPKGLVVTRAVQTKAGWVGQVVVDQDIIWESDVFVETDEDNNGDDPSELAEQAATERVINVIKGLFSS